MNDENFLRELKRYETEIDGIRRRFVESREHITIGRGDDALLRQYVQELIDFFRDTLGPNDYSRQIAEDFNYAVSNWLQSPSLAGVQNILATVRSACTRFERDPSLLAKAKVAKANRSERGNVFIIHGRDEAKWRELKDIVRTEFQLNPIVLLEKPDHGCKTVIEKFEYYAPTCSYAIALFTPDDEVTANGETYLQARPNVIYEIGWFCGALSRSCVMLLLKEGTHMFSDFGGIIQKRFVRNVSEKIGEIRQELVAAKIVAE
jgi:predicted nucleotide-binding protein